MTGGGTDDRRWWLDPALARVAFGADTRTGNERPSQSIASAMASALEEHAEFDETGFSIDLDDPAQRSFGDYELIELIGRGGMGVVYRARQHGLDREVAIKLLSAGNRAPADLVESLRREARHAARLQHPNIVAVHEMGEHGDLIFFAMQLVRGPSLSQRIDTGGPLPPRQAARLLRTVAEAVDYAHRFGVLHLDLKPGNVLLDEDGTPLIADFGLARRLEQEFDQERISGTPGYMAPEQASKDGPPLSPATDVWALGAMLYEMLTGLPPFHAESTQATIDLLLHADVAPLPRSAQVPPDLEAICLHCLRKDPAHRYASARALADDLGRFLDDRPVQARPLHAGQSLLRWTRREPKLVSAIGLGLLILLGGSIATALQWRRAESNARVAQEVNRFLNDDVLAAADPYLASGKERSQITVPELLADAESRIDRGLVDQPAARAQIGLTLGRAYFGIGLWKKSRERLLKALADARASVGADATLSLEIEQQLGLTATYDGDYALAGSTYQHLIATRHRQSGWDAPATIAARRGRALLLYETDHLREAQAEYESLRVAAREHATDQLPDIEWTLSDIYTETNRWDEAEALIRNVLARSRKELGPLHPQYLWETTTLGDLLNMRGRWDEAEAVIGNARVGLLRSVGAEHPKSLTTLHYLGQIELFRGRPASALPLLQQAMEGRMRVNGPAHKYTHYSMNRVGEALTALGRPREAIPLLQRAIALATAAGQRRHVYVALILDNLALAYMAIGEPDRADACLAEALASVKTSLPANNVRRAMIERSLGKLRAMQGNLPRAREHYRYAARVFGEGFGQGHPWVLDLRTRLDALDTTTTTTTRAAEPH